MKKLIVVAMGFVFVGGINSFAEPLSERAWEEKHTWELGAEVSHIYYDEPDVMHEKGFMYGIFWSCTYHNNLILMAEGRYSYGQVDYQNSGTMKNVDDYMLEFRGLGGYDFSILKASTLTPYIGIGYRYLNDDMSNRQTSTDAWGYEREISYIYCPIGIKTITQLKNGWSIGLILEYDYFWDGTVKSNMGYLAGYYDIENDQDEGYGARGSIKLQKEGETMDYVIEPFVRYWDIEDSEYTTDPGGTTWYEPENNSTEFGVKLAVKY